jgi:hypothetical protein
MRQVDAAHRCRRRHRKGLGQVETDVLGAEQLEQLALLTVVGTRGIAEGRTDAAEPLGDQVLLGQVLVRRVPLAPRRPVQELGESLREPIGQRLDHDRVVVVVLGLVASSELVGTMDGDAEGTDVVIARRDVVGQAAVRT